MDIVATITREELRRNPRAVEEAVERLHQKGYPLTRLRHELSMQSGDVVILADESLRPVCSDCGGKHNPANECVAQFIEETEHPLDLEVEQPPHRAWVLVHAYSDGSGSPNAETTRVYLREDRAKADLALVKSTHAGSEWHLLETQVFG